MTNQKALFSALHTFPPMNNFSFSPGRLFPRHGLTLALAIAALAPALLLTPISASAQSVETVVDNMQALYEEQLRTIDTFIVETNQYTTYYEKVIREGTPTYRSTTRLEIDAGPSFADEAPTTIYGFDFEQLRQHARYGGTETIDGTRAHVLVIDDPAAFDPEMEMPTESGAARLVYYIGAAQHMPVRMVMESDESDAPESRVVVDLKDYRTTDRLTLPHRMEMQVNLALSDEERREMEHMMEQLRSLPEQQRKQMEKMMGESMNMVTGMMSGEPIVIEVQSVKVNTELPPGTFADSANDR